MRGRKGSGGRSGRGRGMSADKQSGPFSKPIAGGQNNSATIEALKEQIRIEVADCRGCRRCVEACPQEAIVLTAA